jgi:hypothetical protein
MAIVFGNELGVIVSIEKRNPTGGIHAAAKN